MSLNVEMELPIREVNVDVLSCSVLNPVLVWNCSSNMVVQALVPLKMVSNSDDFENLHSAQINITIQN